jgi:hypothetical protein
MRNYSLGQSYYQYRADLAPNTTYVVTCKLVEAPLELTTSDIQLSVTINEEEIIEDSLQFINLDKTLLTYEFTTPDNVFTSVFRLMNISPDYSPSGLHKFSNVAIFSKSDYDSFVYL